MTDRDRLIELLKPHVSGTACLCESGSCELTSCRDCKARRLADHLLANGVFILPEDLRDTEDFSISDFIEAMQMYKEKDRYIKLPCKVGDTVYIKNRPLIISFLHIENEVHYVIQFDCDDCGDCPFYEDDVSFEGEHDCKTMGYIQFTEKDIGKTVFLTKEEAEAKLKEREKI